MLWEKLKQLEKTCHVRVESLFRQVGGLVWKVTIQAHDGREPIVVEQPDITEAVREGVARAEREGFMPMCGAGPHTSGDGESKGGEGQRA